ncbi:MAG TPA: carboxypeptidase-like regulatory domain-containing protein [Chitinophagaceae bacterium]|nr:carboxypeptidase-like regulatory domain-containing protein [Chitinophagaceae bacterium]
MKKSIFFPVVGLVLLFSFLTSCSKDPQLTHQDETKAYYEPIANAPEILYGSMKGFLDPVPSYASILLKGEAGYSVEKIASGDGSFWFSNLPAGNYYMRITYVVRTAGYSYIAYHEIEELKVIGGIISEVGSIKLPWSY